MNSITSNEGRWTLGNSKQSKVQPKHSFKFVRYYLHKVDLMRYYNVFVREGLGDHEVVFLTNSQLEKLNIPYAHRIIILSCFNPSQATVARHQQLIINVAKNDGVSYNHALSKKSSFCLPSESILTGEFKNEFQVGISKPDSLHSKSIVCTTENEFIFDCAYNNIMPKKQLKKTDNINACNISNLLCTSETVMEVEPSSLTKENMEVTTIRTSTILLPNEDSSDDVNYFYPKSKQGYKIKIINQKRESRKESRLLAEPTYSRNTKRVLEILHAKGRKGNKDKATSCQYHYDKKAACDTNCVGHKYFPRGTEVPNKFYMLAKGNHIELHAPLYEKYKNQRKKHYGK